MTYLSTRDAAALLSVSVETLRRLIKGRQDPMPAPITSRLYRIRRDAIEQWAMRKEK